MNSLECFDKLGLVIVIHYTQCHPGHAVSSGGLVLHVSNGYFITSPLGGSSSHSGLRSISHASSLLSKRLSLPGRLLYVDISGSGEQVFDMKCRTSCATCHCNFNHCRFDVELVIKRPEDTIFNSPLWENFMDSKKTAIEDLARYIFISIYLRAYWNEGFIVIQRWRR